MRTVLFAVVASLLAAPLSVASCPGSHPLFGAPWWAQNCQSPGVVVTGDATGGTAFVGNDIHIVATANIETPGHAIIYIQGTQNGLDVGDVTVFSVGGPLTVELVFRDSIRHVGSLKIAPTAGNGVRNLYIEGAIAGNLGEVEATAIGVHPSGLGFRLSGSLVGNVRLKDTEIAPELRTHQIVVRGSIAPNLTIDAESGGIGTLEVWGVIGADGGPVLIRSGRDITRITAGQMHTNIVAGRDDPNDDPDLGMVWANIQELRTLFDTQNGAGPVHTGDFVGTVYANTIGEPIRRSFEVESSGISQIEVQGNLSAILDFDSAIVPDQTFPGSQIVVGGDFLGDSIIRVPAGGLAGQLIFNFNGAEDGVWVTDGASGARVLVGQTTLAGPTYPASAASIGGGAVGLAGFQFHRQSCEPAIEPLSIPNSILVVQGDLVLDPLSLEIECVFDNPSVLLQFYGPVGINSPANDPAVTIERHRAGLAGRFAYVRVQYLARRRGEADRLSSRFFLDSRLVPDLARPGTHLQRGRRGRGSRRRALPLLPGCCGQPLRRCVAGGLRPQRR
ncbi:MAG: hypothetical protein IBJ10_04960 [Phycisphaerales bacterium]|nr:hypothetical protein [Phycisphaerales bacterium]